MDNIPNSFELDGRLHKPKIGFWNLPNQLLQRLILINSISSVNINIILDQKGHQINTVKNAIIDHIMIEKYVVKFYSILQIGRASCRERV